MQEHALIAQYFAPLTQEEPGAFLLRNDAAVLQVPYGKQLVTTSDSAIEGWHVPKDATPAQLAEKLMRRNISDLAAMGATPWRYSLNVNVPKHYPETYIAAFAKALFALQQKFGLILVGGDTTFHGAHAYASLTMFGLLDAQHRPHLRSGSKPGDILYCTGPIGDAALGLMLLEGKIELPECYHEGVLEAYYRPTSQLALGQALLGVASSVIDVSDGLKQDLAHLAQQSRVAITLDEDAVPFSDAAQYAISHNPALKEHLLTAGDDYALLFTADQKGHIGGGKEYALSARIYAIGQVL